MHLCFVDESGTPAKPNQPQPRHFVIAGVIIPEERWSRASNLLMGLKRRRNYHGELKWRYFAPSNNDDENPMRDWGQADRNTFRQQAFDILTGDHSIKVIAGVCAAELAYALPNVNGQSDLYFRTYKVVTERFQYFLQDIGKASGTFTRGLIIADHRGSRDDNKIRAQHQRLVDSDSKFTATYKNLVEGLFLAPSHMSVGVQLADMAAGAIWRSFEHDDDTWLNVIRPCFRTSNATGVIDGFGIARFPREGWTSKIIA